MSQRSYIDDPQRLQALARMGLVEGERRPSFDKAASIASCILDTPVNLLALVGDEDQFHIGEARQFGENVPRLPIDDSLCRIVVQSRRPLMVRDARDNREVSEYGIVPGEGVVAYMGVPVHAPDGQVIGSFCAVDPEPREWSADQLKAMLDLSDMIATELTFLETAALREAQADQFRAIIDGLPVGVAVAEIPSAKLVWRNAWGMRMLDERIVAEGSRHYQGLGALHPDGVKYDAEEYPLVRAAVYGETVKSEPMHYRRANGSVIELEVSARRIGEDELAVATFVDVTDRKLAEGSAQIARDQLEHVLRATADPIIVIDRFWVITYVNDAAKKALADGRNLVEKDVWESFPAWANGPIRDAYQDAMRSGAPGTADVLKPDAETIYEARAFPSNDELTVFFRDVTAERNMDETRRLLVRELNHRVKNLFAVVTGMIAMTSRHASSPTDMARALRGRIAALAQAHELIRPALSDDEDDHDDVALQSLVVALIGPHLSTERSRDGADDGWEGIVVDGPTVTISAQGASALSLVLHELATNAAKYGALSVTDGELNVGWTVEGENLRLTWRERGGPAIEEPPKTTGFGSTLIAMTIERQLGGKLDIEWEPEGVSARLAVRMDRLKH